MIELGKTQCLNIVKVTDFGVYLGTEEDKVLLPKKQVPDDVEEGDALTVFVYRDSSDRLIATTNKPKIQLGELKRLKVSQVTGIGAFLDWGLEKAAGDKGVFWALLLFVGIPLPGTGAWTGTLAASILDWDFKRSVIAVMLGVILAGIIMGTLSLLLGVNSFAH